MSKFPNFEAEIARRGLKKKAMAKDAGMSYRSFYNKSVGSSEFTLSEACFLRDKYFPDLDFQYLYHRPT